MPINKERLLLVADHIETYPEQFDQLRWCGTACCVAGLTVKLFDTDEAVVIPPIPHRAGDLLGLDMKQRTHLFGFGLSVCGGRTPTAPAMAAEIRRFVAADGAF